MKALDELIAEKYPAMHGHMVTLGADISLAATDWFLCLFAAAMPSETVARVWDALFNEGPKILFRRAPPFSPPQRPSSPGRGGKRG